MLIVSKPSVNSFSLSEAQNHMFMESEGLGRFRIFPKGRRLGATNGGAIAFIKWMLEGNACLWGDTINSNIDRYVERYFKPFLNTNKISYSWNSQRKLIEVGDGYTDFRSADRPENWEGFGYHKIFLNEAGIILDNEYLYMNAVLPMMIDFTGSQLIAAGTPKLLSGKGKFFYELWLKAERGENEYYSKTYTTYDNPFLSRKQIELLEMEIPANERKQEIYGEFLLSGGSMVQMDWFQRYNVKPANPIRTIHSWDTASKDREFNDPSVCTVWIETPGNYYLIDVFVSKLKYPDLKRTIKSMAMRDSPDAILIEDKSSGISLIQDLRSDPEFAYNILPITPVRSKTERFSTATLTIESGRVHLPKSAPWLPAYETEIIQFPNGAHDDQADSTSQFINWVKTPKEIFIG